jgi:hypothetical protein
MDDLLDTEEFYNVMQVYRWAGLIKGGSREEDVVPAFEAVKDWIRAHYVPASSASGDT